MRILTSVQSVGELLQHVRETRHHVNAAQNLAHDVVVPLEKVEQLSLNLGGTSVVGVKVVGLSLLLQLLALVELAVAVRAASHDLGEDALELADVGGVGVLSLI